MSVRLGIVCSLVRRARSRGSRPPCRNVSVGGSMSTFAKSFALAWLIAIAVIAPRAQADDQNRVDWPKFLGRHDLVYSRLPDSWKNGAFTGNGVMGAMVYLTDDKSALRFRIGRTDVEVQDGAAFRPAIGDLVLIPAGKITGGNLRLNLWDAEITGAIQTDRGEIGVRTFTHSKDPVQIIEI